MRPAADERAHAQRVLTFALDVGMQMFRQGLETDGIVHTVRGLAAAEQVEDLQISVGARTIHVQHRPPDGGEPVLLMGSVDANDARDIGRMADLEALARRVGRGEITLDDGERRIASLSSSAPT